MDTPTLLAPHDADTEREVLCAAIVNPDRCAHLAETLEPADFYPARHRAIWEAVQKCYANHGTVDEALIVAYLRAVSYTHLRAHETLMNLVCRLLLEKKK